MHRWAPDWPPKSIPGANWDRRPGGQTNRQTGKAGFPSHPHFTNSLNSVFDALPAASEAFPAASQAFPAAFEAVPPASEAFSIALEASVFPQNQLNSVHRKSLKKSHFPTLIIQTLYALWKENFKVVYFAFFEH